MVYLVGRYGCNEYALPESYYRAATAARAALPDLAQRLGSKAFLCQNHPCRGRHKTKHAKSIG